jgi:AraC-like DNA-binding protein
MCRKDFEIQHKRDTYLQNVELHHHDFYEIYFLVSGDVTYSIEGKLYRVVPGDVLLISPRELHQIFIKSDAEAYERYVLWIDPAMLTRLSTETTNLEKCLNPARDGYTNQLRIPIEYMNEVGNLMEGIYRESDCEGYGGDLMQESLIVRLLVLINRIADSKSEKTDEEPYTNMLVAGVINYVNEHYGETLSLDDMAERLYVSKYHLSHEFRRQMGTGVYHYIQKKRVQIARQLLAQGEKPNNVYRRCGFGDYAGFYRAFKAEYGAGPREFAASLKQ